MAPHPQTGDVLVSRTSERVEHEVRIVPEPLHTTCNTHDEAVASARELAERLHVDLWLTEDHIHFLRLGSYRSR